MKSGRAPLGMYFPGSARRPIAHGTIGGYRAHFRHGEPMCEPCRHAHRLTKGLRGPQRKAQCGTCSGYNAHRRLGEESCQACRAALAEAQDLRHRQRRGDLWSYDQLVPVVVRMTSRGLTVAEIADALGVSKLRVGRARVRAERGVA